VVMMMMRGMDEKDGRSFFEDLLDRPQGPWSGGMGNVQTKWLSCTIGMDEGTVCFLTTFALP